MGKGLDAIMQTTIETAKSGVSADSKDSDTPEKDAVATPGNLDEVPEKKDVVVDSEPVVEEGVEGDEKPGDTPVVPKKSQKGYRKGLQSAVNRKHAQLMGESEAHGVTKQELAASKLRIAQLESAQGPAPDLDSEDDDQGRAKDTFSKKEVEAMVAEAVNGLKTKETKNLIDNEYSRMSVEFQGLLEDAYADDFDEELGMLDDATNKKVELLASRFKESPKFWLDTVKSMGMDETLAFITGKKKVDIKEIIKKKEVVDLESGSHKVKEVEPEVKGLEGVMKSVLRKIKK